MEKKKKTQKRSSFTHSFNPKCQITDFMGIIKDSVKNCVKTDHAFISP